MLDPLLRWLRRLLGNSPAAPAAHQAPGASPVTDGATTMSQITTIADVRRHFLNNKEPIYFISATNFNLLGIGDWVGNFRHINYIDCFEGQQRNVFVPKEKFPATSRASRTSTTTSSSTRRSSTSSSPVPRARTPAWPPS